MRLIGIVAVLTCCLSGPLFGIEINIGQVTGQVWYSKAGQSGATILGAQSKVEEGTLVTDVNGEVYAVPFPGSRFRLAPLTTLEMRHNDMKTSSEGRNVQEADLALKRGKITVFLSSKYEGNYSYDIELAGGRLAVKKGIFVVCVHGEGAHIFVAQGTAMLYPLQGPYKNTGIRFEAQTNVALLSKDGELEIRPMTRVAPGTSTCLLCGVTPEIVEHIEEGSPRAANLPGAPEVSISH